jgi:hypothetical protein
MNILLIGIAMVSIGIAGYLQGRRVGARSMALTIGRTGERLFPGFRIKIAKGMLEDLNKMRVESGMEPLNIEIKEKE